MPPSGNMAPPEISVTRWLPGFARGHYLCTESMPYAPMPSFTGHHIKSCHPADKQYTEFIMYTNGTCSLFFICNNKLSMARAALWDGL